MRISTMTLLFRGLGRMASAGLLFGVFAANSCGGGGNPPLQNQAPTARLSADLLSGNAPLAVRLSAAASTDPEGSLTSFSWDFDGDGNADATSSGSQIDFLYTGAGSFEAAVSVQDNGGLRDTATVSIVVSAPSYQGAQVDAARANPTLSAVLVDGNPAVCWIRQSDGALLFSRAQDSAGLLWGSPEVLEESGVDHASLEVVAGRPAVAYRRSSDARLLYVGAGDAQGSVWPLPGSGVEISSDPNLLTFGLRLLEADGKPLIIAAFGLGFNEAQLFVLRSADSAGSSWARQPLPITSINDSAGAFASAIIGGRPALALGERGGDGADLQYIQSLDAAGINWPAASSDVADGVDGFSTSFILEEIAGRPAIAGVLTPEGSVSTETVLLQAQDAAGTSWQRNTTVPQFEDSFVLDMQVIAGFPVIALDDTVTDGIRLLLANDPEGSSFQQELFAVSEDGFPAALLEVNQRPALAFVPESGTGLGFASAQ